MINETNLAKLAFVLAANGGGSGSGSSSDGGGGSGSSGGGIMVVSSTYDDQTGLTTLGKTWQEIYDALREGVLCIVQDDPAVDPFNSAVGLACSANTSSNGYYVRVIINNTAGIISMEYTADAADGYPSVED